MGLQSLKNKWLMPENKLWMKIHFRSSYEKEINASIKLVDSYINMLKENGVYDNSVIVVMADHGYWTETNARQNPFLYIKGFDEHHDYQVSDKKVSYVNLQDAFANLLDGKKSNELFENLDNEVRRYLYYVYTKEKYITEMTLKGHAWELENLKETGKKFNR